jgi:putative FmdB family regulatory protein
MTAMPTYQYRCLDCAAEHEFVQKFTDDPKTDCPDCDGNLRKVYSAVGVVFKGSGFYATDNRTKGKSNAASAATTGDSSSGSSTAKESSTPAPASAPAKSTGGSSAA